MSSSSSVVTPSEVQDMVDRPSSPVNGGDVDFESYCNDRQREAAMTTTHDDDGLEARFSPPQLGHTPAHNAAVLASSSPVVTANNTPGSGGGIYSLFSVSASDNSDFTSKN